MIKELHHISTILFLSAQIFVSFGQISYNPSDIKGPMCVVHDTINKITRTISPAQSQYNVVITDGFAHITLVQKFINPGIAAKNIVYVFPLPDNGSVHAMQMEYRNQLYKARILEKKRAQQIYDSVTALGQNAALLVQERPNIFQQSLSNIAIGDSAYIQIKISMPLKYNFGQYELTIPTMIGARYQSSGASYVPSTGGLWNPPADRDGQMTQINILLQTGFPVKEIASPTHPVDIKEIWEIKDLLAKRNLITSSTQIVATNAKGIILSQSNTYPNKDYVLRFKRAVVNSDFTFASHYDSTYKTGHFVMTLFPDDTIKSVRQNMEIVLLIDISGSQDGWPLQKEKEIAKNILSRLKPADRVTVLAFSDNVYWALNKKIPSAATADTIALLTGFINNLNTQGGTQLLDGVKTALSTPSTTEHQRYYIFLTDGFITNETAIISEIQQHNSKPTIFTFGAGNSLNRYFLESCAKVGNGFATEITEFENAAAMVEPAWQKLASPQIKNISVAIGSGIQSNYFIPGSAILYTGDPLTIYGTYTGSGQSTITIKGYRDGSPVEFTKEVTFANGLTANFIVPQLWARQEIDQLMLAQGVTTNKVEQIIATSEKYQVLSNYTAFLAITPQTVTGDESIDNNIRNSFSIPVIEKGNLITLNQFLFHYAKNIINLQLTGDTFKEICIFDMFGRILFRINLQSGKLSKFVWNGKMPNGTNLQSGKYIMIVQTMSGKQYKKTFSWMR
jgi:Ca-activated chloride channel family protein